MFNLPVSFLFTAAFKVVFMLSKAKGNSYFSAFINVVNSQKNTFHSKYKGRISSENFSVCTTFSFFSGNRDAIHHLPNVPISWIFGWKS